MTSRSGRGVDFGLISSLAAVSAPVALVTLAGFLWRKSGLGFDQDFVTRSIVMLGAPALVFETLSQSALPLADLARIGAATVACLLLFAALAVPALKILGLSQRTYLPALVFPNIGNMGLPICLTAFGPRGLALAMIYFTVTTFGQFAFGPAIARGKFSLAGVLRAPFLYAAAIGVLFAQAGWSLPKWLSDAVHMLGQITIPLMLLGLGAALAEFRAVRLSRALALSAARIGFGALGGALVAAAFGLDGVSRGVVIVQSAMPVAIFNYLFARMYGGEADEIAGLVLASTILAYVAIPAIVFLVR